MRCACNVHANLRRNEVWINSSYRFKESPNDNNLSKNLSYRLFKHIYLLQIIFLLNLDIKGGLAQLARALAWHARGHRFDSDILHQVIDHYK